jgi:hypothetical protein
MTLSSTFPRGVIALFIFGLAPFLALAAEADPADDTEFSALQGIKKGSGFNR